MFLAKATAPDFSDSESTGPRSVTLPLTVLLIFINQRGPPPTFQLQIVSSQHWSMRKVSPNHARIKSSPNQRIYGEIHFVRARLALKCNAHCMMSCKVADTSIHNHSVQ